MAQRVSTLHREPAQLAAGAATHPGGAARFCAVSDLRLVHTGLGHDPRRKAVVAAVVTVVDSLDLRVIAEGVETEAQAHRAAGAGCHYLQGFHCGRPRSADDLTAQRAH